MHKVCARGILSQHHGINPYRGCTHGCIYCDSRSRCYHIDHDFEDVAAKENAPELLEQALRGKRKKCVIATGSMCDPYMPVESELRLTRRCLEVIERHGFGATVLTKSSLILRDKDLLASIHRGAKCVAQMTLTTADDKLCRVIEPNVCPTSERVRALKALHDQGIPTAVWLCPLLPFLNDTRENVTALAAMCAGAGVTAIVYFGAGVTLREGSREHFYECLDASFPGLKKKYAEKYGLSCEVASDRDEELTALLREKCAEYGILFGNETVFSFLRSMPEEAGATQLSLFDL